MFGAFTTFEFNIRRRGAGGAAEPVEAGIFVDVFNVLLRALDLLRDR
jgi:hypothetical protein